MLKIFKRMSKKEWILLIISGILVVGQVYMDLTIPDYMSEITRLVKTEGSPMDAIYKAGIAMVVCAFISMLFAFAVDIINAAFSAIFAKNLREDIFVKVTHFSLSEIDNFSTASLITRSTGDVTQLQNFATRGLNMLIRLPITLTIGIIKIINKEWEWIAVTGFAVMVLLSLIFVVIRYARPKFMRMQQLTDDMNKVTREHLTGIRVIRTYNAEKYQEDKFEKSNDILTNNALTARLAMNVMHPTMKFLNNGLTIAIYFIGAFLISNAIGTGRDLQIFSDMIVFSNYASRILMSFMVIRMLLMQWPRASVSSERINQILDTESVIKDGSVEHGLDGREGEIEFKNVSFKYPGSEAHILTDISFTAHKGETIAFIGSTGSGKTSLVNLVPRFYDASSGEVLVDGVNVKEYKQKSLRNIIGYAPQRAVLFTGSVESNINYGKNGKDLDPKETETEIEKAIRIAQAEDFVTSKGGISSTVTRGGSNVSGGQKQRLSIARTIFRKPEIYIFDDTFSALDYKTDKTLRAALKNETAGVTTLIVAQRIGTIRDADKIIVLDEGRIVGTGTHEELLKNCTVYQEIAHTQLSEEELANG